MNIKNLNVFRRLDELETANLHLQVMLKVARAEIESLKAVLRLRSEPKAAPTPEVKAVKPMETLESTRAKKAAYARTYYAKKRAAAKAAA
jgi:hypothetical protein